MPEHERAANLPEAHRVRLLACHLCHRIWEHYPPTWAAEVFANDDGHPGGYVDPADWENPVMRNAIKVAEDHTHGLATADELAAAHQAVEAFTKEISDNWSWANHRLGDSASGAEYEVGAVTFHTASTCTAASAPEVDVAHCSENAAHAIGFRWDRSERTIAVNKELEAHDEIMRKWKAPDFS